MNTNTQPPILEGCAVLPPMHQGQRLAPPAPGRHLEGEGKDRPAARPPTASPC